MSDFLQSSDEEFEQRVRRALASKPISNEEITRRSKGGDPKAAPSRS